MQLNFDWEVSPYIVTQAGSNITNEWSPNTSTEQDEVYDVDVDGSDSWISLYDFNIETHKFIIQVDANPTSSTRTGSITLNFHGGTATNVLRRDFTITQYGTNEDIELILDRSSYGVSNQATTISSGLTFIGDSVTYEKDASWVTIGSWTETSVQRRDFVLRIEANSSTATRTATINFIVEKDEQEISRSMIVTQSGGANVPIKIKFNENPTSFNAAGGTKTLTYQVTAGTDKDIAIDDHYTLDWAEVTSVNYYNNSFTVVCQPNESLSARSGVLGVMLKNDSGTWWGFEFTVNQAGDNTPNNYIPSWRDEYYVFSSDEAIYTIKNGNDTIFSGRALASPNEQYASVNVTPIINNYIESKLTFSNTSRIATGHPKADGTFRLLLGDTHIATYHVHNDWSYDEDMEYDYEEDGFTLSKPINGHFDQRMRLFFTVYKGATNNWNLQSIVNGVKSTISTFNLSSHPYTTTISLNAVPSSYDGVCVDDIVYDKKVCGKGALYYRNRFGGYDCFVIEGNISKKDTFEKDSICTIFKNINPFDFGKKNYHKKITTNYTLTTNWLSDEESTRLAFNLLASPEVYFHNFETGKIETVVITNSEAEYKKFRNGKQMINYTINLESSQHKLFK